MKLRFRPWVDSLEERCLLAAGLTATFDDGVLKIQGTDGIDQIVVRQARQVIWVKGTTIDVDGAARRGIPAAEVSEIQIYGAGGSDVISLANVTVAAKVWGGKGSDYIVGSNANDMLCGDEGSDRIFGRAGDDLLEGGLGNDKLRGQAGDDTLVGGGGVDELLGQTGANTIYRNNIPPASSTFVGMQEDAARAAIEAQGYVMRVVHRDGESLIVTMDFRTDRINVAVVDGIVTEAAWEYPEGFPESWWRDGKPS